MTRRIVVVGAGQVAAVAARTLRRRGFDGAIEIVGDEPDAPYQRPPLSKEYLATADDDGLFLLPEKWRAENDVHLRVDTTVTSVDRSSGAVVLSTGESLPADEVLLATGGRARELPGVRGERVVSLRTRRDADRLRAHLGPGKKVIVVGAGFIGAEVAATARARGADVVIIEALDVPLRDVLGPEMGQVCADLHRARGVQLRLNDAVESVSEFGAGVEVATSSGWRFEGDVVVVGIGMVPNVGVAEASGIDVDNGILVDELGRTNLPHVYAAGDVANQFHPQLGERVRVEHFDNASKQAAAAANAMLGRAAPPSEPHWFWSDQHEVNLQFTGIASETDELVVRGSVDELDFCAFYVCDGLVRAAFAADRGGEVQAAKELISSRMAVTAEVLRDEDVDLLELAMDGELA